MGPSQYPLSSGPIPGPGHGRRLRRCLLKGCEQWYQPTCPQSRYCGEACRQAARRWRRGQAGRRWRATPQGQECRREQGRRYRQRRRERAAAASADVVAACEGQRPATSTEDFPERRCVRPGCYVTFTVQHEHACRCFCSVACRLALRRVLDREARWRERRRKWRREPVTRRSHRPDTS